MGSVTSLGRARVRTSSYVTATAYRALMLNYIMRNGLKMRLHVTRRTSHREQCSVLTRILLQSGGAPVPYCAFMLAVS